jgi:hypothetical protein
MPSVGFEPTIPVSERAKTVYARDGAATVTGRKFLLCLNITQKPCGKDGWEGRKEERKKRTKERRYFLADFLTPMSGGNE